MPDLRKQIGQLLQGRVCLMGLGNVDYADEADMALEELLELFAEVRHQISSPSFLICS